MAPPFETSFEWADLRFSVSLLPGAPDRLRLRSEVENLAPRLRAAYIPLCFPWIRAYREGRLAWDQWRERGCDGTARLVEIPAGGRESRHDVLSADAILGDSLPGGQYALALYVPGAARPGQPPRAPMELPLGRVRLRRAPGRPARSAPEPAPSAEGDGGRGAAAQ